MGLLASKVKQSYFDSNRILRDSLLLVWACLFTWSSPSLSYNTQKEALPAQAQAPELVGVGITERLNQQIDLSLEFKDENNQNVRLEKFFGDGQPVIISPVYYGCGHLCNFHLDGLFAGLKSLDWTAGRQFKLLAVSFDSTEGAELALKKKKGYLSEYHRPGAEEGVHFLTGSEISVRRLMEQLGFRAKFNSETNDWAHSSAAILTNSQGKVMRYLPGIVFEPKDLRFAINEVAEGRVGGLVDALVLYCFQYNPHKSGYSLAAFRVMQLGGLVTLIIFALFLIPIWMRLRKEQRKMTRSSS